MDLTPQPPLLPGEGEKEEMMAEQQFKFTVHCYDDKKLRRHFVEKEQAVNYANELLRGGHRVKIFPYKPAKRPVDYAAERGPRG